ESGAPTPAPAPVQPEAPKAPEDPVETKVRQIFGDDPRRAAEAILATNNRAAAMATKLREMGLDPKTLQPLAQAQPPVQAPPALLALPDPKVIVSETNRLLDNDPAFVSLVQTWVQGDTRAKAIASERSLIQDEVKQLNYALKIPEIASDDYKKDQYASQLATKEQTLLKLSLEESIIEAKQERLNAAASRFTERARNAVTQHFQTESQARAEEAELAQYQEELYAQYSTSWPLAVEKAIADAKIPAELVEDFREDAKIAALAHIQNTDAAIDDLYQFVGKRAQGMMDRLDRFHRMQSATYGAQATARTAVASTPSTPVPPSSPTQPTPFHPSLASFEKSLEAEAALIGKQMGLW
ncbi:MAG: hypothetical protein ACRD2L_25805, partial [Terriglobia bacterium]